MKKATWLDGLLFTVFIFCMLIASVLLGNMNPRFPDNIGDFTPRMWFGLCEFVLGAAGLALAINIIFNGNDRYTLLEHSKLDLGRVYKVVWENKEHGYTVLETTNGLILTFELLSTQEHPLTATLFYKPKFDSELKRMVLLPFLAS